MSVGVITVHHLDDPLEPIEGFLADLYDECSEFDLEEPEVREEALVTNDGLPHVNQRYLERRATEWADSQGIGPYGWTALYDWINALPWSDNVIILQLGN